MPSTENNSDLRTWGVHSRGALRRAPLPDLSHLTGSDFDAVYEPSDDTFLLIDVLSDHAPELLALAPAVCIEIGAGSGAVITGLARALAHESTTAASPLVSTFLATDVNPAALEATVATAARNGVLVHAVHMDLLCAMRAGCIDVLVFNPPYVPTSMDELVEAEQSHDISAAWAGGPRGRLVLDRLLPSLSKLLSPRGVFYLLGVRENDPSELISILAQSGLCAVIVAERRAQNERLFILRARREA
mmetsp:Transcript_22540/g.48674  ORF Transcript_22540/g.48674 Transcript_22540/m.48674 type:complete len:246 (-) Transcript_22540:528-1265(-)|eukprot:CAMPEP_0183353328 /NCGR_PEP_ID=MMETSP0164_2-20130417/33192_1 /TAXON_ID=221442 /ORGANISM="Coccolithus pelagicus ssp braarudi, Strain PLY182g" /LENGTH=245 /DNA_ID=CAMNT_0025525987 /DNA_START=193 /DNA_END=930 /DNA_ORIENTATION=+